MGDAWRYDDVNDAVEQLKKSFGPHLKPVSPKDAKICTGGDHWILQCNGKKVGSVVCCECCEDTTIGPIMMPSKCMFRPFQ